MTETHTCFECNGAGYLGRLDWGLICSACHGNGYIFSERAPKSATHVSSMRGTGASWEGMALVSRVPLPRSNSNTPPGGSSWGRVALQLTEDAMRARQEKAKA